MFKGGPIYTHAAAQVLRYAELLIPVPLLIYGLLVQAKIISTSYDINFTGFSILMVIWFFVGFLQFFIPTKTKRVMILRNVTLHLLIGSYLLFVTGIASPIAGGWVIITLSAYVLLATKGAIYSVLTFILFAAIDILIFHKADSAVITNDMLTAFVVLVSGIITASIFQTQKVSQEKINDSKAREFLQRDRILTLVNNLTDAILSVDLDGIIRVYNAASLNLLDTNNSLNGLHIDEVLGLTNKANEEVSIFSEIKKARTVIKRDDLNYSFDDGEKIRLEITYAPIRSSYNQLKKNKKQDGFIIIMRDVTKAKSLEEERDEFISVTSHELRTPITIAEGTLSNLQIMIEHPDVTHEMLKESVNTAHEQILFLAHMVNDLSTLSRAERGVADIAEDIDIRELAHTLHDKYLPDAKAKKLHLNLDLSPKLGKVHVSRLYLEELLQNFMTNAIKYTKEGKISLIIEQKNDEVTFSVKDTGIGVSKPDQSRIFEKFFRSEDYRTRETGGTGLGLYVAAKLAHKIGTKIQFSSRLNFGSTFGFTIPIIKDK